MLVLIGILLGLVVGLLLQVDIPTSLSTYIGVVILASFDSMIGALNASMQNRFNARLFATGLVGNAGIAVLLTALGRALDIQLSMAAVFAFGVRIFNNFSSIRRLWLRRLERRQRYTKAWQTDERQGEAPVLKPSDFNRRSRAQELQDRAQHLRQEADAVLAEADRLWAQEAATLRKEAEEEKRSSRPPRGEA